MVEPQTCKSVAFEQPVPHVQNLFLNDTVSVGMTYSGFVKRMQRRGCVVQLNPSTVIEGIVDELVDICYMDFIDADIGKVVAEFKFLADVIQL